MASVGDALNELHHKVGSVDVKRLSEDEEFVTLLASTTQLAIKTHREEKLDARKRLGVAS